MNTPEAFTEETTPGDTWGAEGGGCSSEYIGWLKGLPGGSLLSSGEVVVESPPAPAVVAKGWDSLCAANAAHVITEGGSTPGGIHISRRSCSWRRAPASNQVSRLSLYLL